MRVLLFILLFTHCLVSVAQKFPGGKPNQFTTGWNKSGYDQSDSGTIVANRDTTFKPRFSATLVFRPVDRKFYYYDSTTLRWYPLASDTSGSVNDRFDNLAALTVSAGEFPINSILGTKGFTAPNDGGAATYIISADTIAGLPVDSVSQIRLSNGLFCVLYHGGSVRWEQFGAVGDSITNDMTAFDRAINYIRKDRSVITIYGNPEKTYRLSKLSLYPGDIDLNCFVRIDFGNITFDFQGAKVIFDNNATQSYVYYTDTGGVTGVYRCKLTNTNQRPTKILYWGEYDWQIMKDSVVDEGLYPVWDSTVLYYGGMDFAHQGFLPTQGVLIHDIVWKNLNLSGNEPDSIALQDGYWNVNTKAFFDYERIKRVTWQNMIMHNVASEVVYGGGTNEIGGYFVDNCEIYVSHNAVSHGGDMRVENCVIHDCPANAVESYPSFDKQSYIGNVIYNCKNGITSGGAGADVNHLADVTISRNRIYDCSSYGVYIVRRARGVSITNNSIYDCLNGNVSLYTLSDLYPDAVSDVRIEGNFIGVYRHNITAGIVMSCANAADSMRNTNIFITSNIFGRLEQSHIEHINASMGSAVDVTGYQYKAVVVANNSVVGGCLRLCSYTITSGYTPTMFNNYFNRGYSTGYVGILFGSDNDYSSAQTFSYTDIAENNTTLLVAPSFSTLFVKSPFIGSLVQPDYDRVNFACLNAQRAVIVPGSQDNLRRAVYMYGNPVSYYIQQLSLVKSNEAYADGAGGSLRYSWRYEGNRVDSVNTTYLLTKSLTGDLAAGDSITVQYGALPFRSDVVYDQIVFDSTASSNIAFNANFSVTHTFNSLFIDVKIKNISGSTQPLGGSSVSSRYYPISKPNKIPAYLQPLRNEGKTDMLPVGDDVPNGFVFFNTETWAYLKWDAQYRQWVSASSTNISSGTSAPVTTPNKIGDIYVDITSKKMYFATGTSSSADWTIAN